MNYRESIIRILLLCEAYNYNTKIIARKNAKGMCLLPHLRFAGKAKQ